MSANPPVSAIVRDCQTALTQLHIDIGVVDGKFGTNTKTGVQQFQTGHGLNPTGQLDVATMKRLLPRRRGASVRLNPPAPRVATIAAAGRRRG